MKPICVPCQRFYRPIKNEFVFIEQMPIGANATPGVAAPEEWKPYKLWMGDLWRCNGCGSEIVVGTALQPLAVQHEPYFEDTVKQFGATYTVNDC